LADCTENTIRRYVHKPLYYLTVNELFYLSSNIIAFQQFHFKLKQKKRKDEKYNFAYRINKMQKVDKLYINKLELTGQFSLGQFPDSFLWAVSPGTRVRAVFSGQFLDQRVENG